MLMIDSYKTPEDTALVECLFSANQEKHSHEAGLQNSPETRHGKMYSPRDENSMQSRESISRHMAIRQAYNTACYQMAEKERLQKRFTMQANRHSSPPLSYAAYPLPLVSSSQYTPYVDNSAQPHSASMLHIHQEEPEAVQPASSCWYEQNNPWFYNEQPPPAWKSMLQPMYQQNMAQAHLPRYTKILSDKRKRTSYTKRQLIRLENEFQASNYITRAKRIELSLKMCLTEQQIKTWFQNRRMKMKKDKDSTSASEQGKEIHDSAINNNNNNENNNKQEIKNDM
eukprot:gene5230-5888_t